MGLFDKLFGKNKGAGAALSGLEREVIDKAEQVVLIAKRDSDRNLDYSIESLQLVDELLEEYHETIDDLDDAAIKGVSIRVGSYILEVARRNFGGTYGWYEEANQPILVSGQPECEVSLLAIEKAKGRIVNGVEDNIPFFFDGFVSAIERGKKESGYRAMIV